MANPQNLTPYDSQTAKAVNTKRWAASEEERITKRIDDLVAKAPALTESQRAKLAALLSTPAEKNTNKETS